MKKIRNFRIELSPEDQVSLAIIDEDSKNFEFLVDNISTSGLGAVSDLGLSVGRVYHSIVTFRHFKVELDLEVIRSYGENKFEKTYTAFLFSKEDEEIINHLIEEVIKSFSFDRKKRTLISLIQSEGHSILDNFKEENESFKLDLGTVFDLYDSFLNYKNNNYINELFLNETARLIKASDACVYFIENEGKDVSIYDLKENKKGDVFYPLSGLLNEVVESRKSMKTKINKEYYRDDFYSLLATLYGKEVSTILLCPIFNYVGRLVGILEFTNRKDGEFFSYNDLKTVELLSMVFSSTFENHFENDSTYMLEHEESLLDYFKSEQGRYIASFVSKQAAGEDNILITGNFGSGKNLIADEIQANSVRSNTGVKTINCHQVQNPYQLELLLLGDNNQVGALEYCNGGTLIIKDINFLSLENQEILYSHISSRDDIRFICTSTQNRTYLEHEKIIYPDLFDYIGVVDLKVDDLSERKEDIIPLIHHFIDFYCHQYGLSKKIPSESLLTKFHNYDWPGNIAELKMAIERLVLLNYESGNIEYHQNRVVPILEREVDLGLIYGINFDHDMVFSNEVIDSNDVEDLYLYFYVDSRLKQSELHLFEIASIVNLDSEKLLEKLFYGNELCQNYFGTSSPIIENLLEKKAA